MKVLTAFMINDSPQSFLHDYFPFKVHERFRKDEIFIMKYIHSLALRYCVIGTILPSQWTEFFIPYFLCQKKHSDFLTAE